MPDTSIERRGFMFVLSSPSGAGKTTLTRLMLERDDRLVKSVSATTRTPRPGEVHGTDYYFTDENEFGRMAINDELLEHARVFGHHYGTPRARVEDALKNGHDVIFDIDWQGTRQLAFNARQDLVSVFILPPSLDELERRLLGRGQDSSEVVERRMAKARDEISHWHEYDYVVINRDLDETLANVRAILCAERLKRNRQQEGLARFVESL